MATETQNRHDGHGHEHHHGHGNGDQHPQGPRQEAVNPDDNPTFHNPRTSELPPHLAKFLRDVETEREDPCPDEIIDELKTKIDNGEKIEVHNVKVCGRENCPEHKGKNSLGEVLNQILGGLKEDLVKLAKERHQRKVEAEEAAKAKKVGKYFVGKAVCDACNEKPAIYALINHSGKTFDEHLEAGAYFVKPVCADCHDTAKKVVGDFLINAMHAPCPLCVPYPITEGQTPPAWASLCETHHQFAQIIRNS